MCIIMIVNNCYDLNGYLKKMLNIVYCYEIYVSIFLLQLFKINRYMQMLKIEIGFNVFYRYDCFWFNVVFLLKCV